MFSARSLGMLVSFTLLAAAGCSGEAQGGGDDEQVELRFTWWGNNERAEITTEAIEAFQEANPGVAVQGEPSDFSGYFDKLATNVAAGDAPDVFTLGGAYPAEYANRGALLDLETVSDTLDLSTFDDASLQNGQVDGTQYAVSTGSNALAVIANPALFEEAGVPLPDTESWTWEDFAEVARQISEATPDDTYGTDAIVTHDTIDAYARQRGENLYTEGGQLGLGQDTLQEFFGLAAQLQESGASPSANIVVEQADAAPEQTLIGTGKAAMMITWSNGLGSLGTASGADLELWPLPGEADTPGVWPQSSQFYAIAADTEHPEEAAALVNFLVNDEEAGQILLTDRGIPANPDVREAISDDLDEQAQAQADYIGLISERDTAAKYIGPAGSTAVQEITDRMHHEVLFGSLGPAEAAQTWMAESEAAIESAE